MIENYVKQHLELSIYPSLVFYRPSGNFAFSLLHTSFGTPRKKEIFSLDMLTILNANTI